MTARMSWHLAVPLVGALLAPLASLASEPSAAELQAEIRHQEELLRRIQRGEPLDDTTQTAPTETVAGSALDSRAAPAAPELRDLPAAIFDQTRVKVPTGKWGNTKRLIVLQRLLDADADGKPELVRFIDPESKLIVRQESDRNYDGSIDAWSIFEWGEIVRRNVDDDGDGKPDGWETYEKGRMSLREVDRDSDGVRDGFYTYRAGSLVLERHDANNDGKIDRTVHYEQRRRTAAEEDLDKDGRVDVWYRYETKGDTEIVAQIQRDKAGRGRPDVFETFEAHGGSATLARREEDVDGDGKIDIVSIYREGRLVRRELSEPDLQPL